MVVDLQRVLKMKKQSRGVAKEISGSLGTNTVGRIFLMIKLMGLNWFDRFR